MAEKDKTPAKRGGIHNLKTGGHIKPPGQNMIDLLTAQLKTARRRAEVIEDPDRPIILIAQDLAEWTRKIVRRGKQKGLPPTKGELDALREFRITQEVVTEYRKVAGADARAELFFASLPDRIQAIAERLPDGLKPPAELVESA